jgi:thiamine biosynthesis protein ThiS
MPEPPTLENLLRLVQPQRPYAVARNEEFVPSSAYAKCKLVDGDRIEIVHPSAGG